MTPSALIVVRKGISIYRTIVLHMSIGAKVMQRKFGVGVAISLQRMASVLRENTQIYIPSSAFFGGESDLSCPTHQDVGHGLR